LDREEIMNEVRDTLQGYNYIYLATIEHDRPRVRPVTLINHDESYWVATGANSAKVSQIKRNPNVELCLCKEEEKGSGYIRLSGTAEIVADHALKDELASNIEFFSDYWNGANDPNYCLLRISVRDIELTRPGEMTAHKATI
jgi:general stress protein 26